MLFTSTGTLRYSIEPNVGHKLIVMIDPQLTEYYFSLIPKYLHVRRQAHHPHISVVRKESPNLASWKIYASATRNEIVTFQYENYLYCNHVYYWLNVYCKRLEEIRRELGLPLVSDITRSPNGVHRFHSTVGNVKAL